MADKQVLDFIKAHLDKGVERAIIEKALIDQGGWTALDVSSAFSEMNSSTITANLTPAPTPAPIAVQTPAPIAATPNQNHTMSGHPEIHQPLQTPAPATQNTIRTNPVPSQSFSENSNYINQAMGQSMNQAKPAFQASSNPTPSFQSAAQPSFKPVGGMSQRAAKPVESPVFSPSSQQMHPQTNQPLSVTQTKTSGGTATPAVNVTINNPGMQASEYQKPHHEGNRIGSIVLRVIQILSLIILVLASFKIPLTEKFVEELRLGMTVNIFMVPVLTIVGFFDAYGLKKLGRKKSRRFALILAWLLLGVGAYFLINFVGILGLFGFVV
jgi:hypothetical protein